MASNHFVALLAIVAIILPSVAMATDFDVGDNDGWKLGVNYTIWAQDKVFHVGDTLVFKYEPPHNVFGVNGDAFKACNSTGGKFFGSGNDNITLSQPGKKWYVCGFQDHCDKGMKLVITVSDGPAAPAPAPTPAAPKSNDSYRFMASWYQIFVAAAVVMAMVAI